MKIRIISCFILLALSGAIANGQVRQPHSLYFMETIPQITQMNPALQPRANGYVMLPGFNYDLLSDLSFKDILQKQGSKWFTPVEQQYDYAKLRKSIGKKSTMFNTGVDVDVLGFGFRTGNGIGYFTFGISQHGYANYALPSDFFKLIDKGLPDGTQLDFSPLRAHIMAYTQLLIGYSTKVNDKLTVGVNVKPLIGHVAVTTKIDKFEWNTGAERWELDAEGHLYSSGPIDVRLDEHGKVDGIDFREFNDMTLKEVRDYTNPGIAFDLGAAYQINERLNVSAALNNLGFISWKNNLNSASFNGQYTFTGLEYNVAEEKSIDDRFEDMLDDMQEQIDYTTQHDKFKTALPPVLNAGAEYQLTRAVSAGLMSRSVFWNKGFRQSFNAAFNLQPYSFVAFNAGATWQLKSNVSVGAGATFLLGPLQFYVLVDGLPVSYSSVRITDSDTDKADETKPFIPHNMEYLTMRMGFNLVFGRHGYANRPMLDKGRSSWN